MDPARPGSEGRDERAQGALAGGAQGPVGRGRTLSLRVPRGTGQGHPSGPAVPHGPASPGTPGGSQGQRAFSWSQQTAPREGADVSGAHTSPGPPIPLCLRSHGRSSQVPIHPRTRDLSSCVPRAQLPARAPTAEARGASARCSLRPCPGARTVDAADAAAAGATAGARRRPSRWRRRGLRAQRGGEERPPRAAPF